MGVRLDRKQHYKNILMNIIAFVVQFVINFYIAPVIVANVGAAAYGFIGLANDFVSYISIVATVFNSVASRFIASEYYKHNYSKANKYFNSLIVTNCIISIGVGLFCAIFVPNINLFLSIPDELLFDVKLSFMIVFISYIVSLITLVFTTSTFVTNRTDIQGIRNVVQYIIRFVLIVVCLNFISVRIYWIAFASLIATVFVAILNVDLTRRLTPELKFKISEADYKYAFVLAKSGSWMALTSIGTILLRGLDLTIANLFIGDYEMGLLSISRTIPNNMTLVISVLAPIFTPSFISLYVKNDNQSLTNSIRDSIKTMAVLLYVPVTCFIVFSYDFFCLWQKSLSSDEIVLVTWLAILTIIQAYFNSTTATMAQISVVVNKLKMPVIITFICGVVSIVAELIMINFFDLGLYSIVISTSVVMIIRYIMFNSIYAAWCLNEKKTVFFIDLIKTWTSIPVLLGIVYIIKLLFPVLTWKSLIVDLILSMMIGYAIMLFLYDKKKIFNLFERIKTKKIKL